MPVTAITHAQCIPGNCGPPNAEPKDENTTSDVANNSTINVQQQQNSSTGSTP